jgi:hypothetical protein
MAGEYEWNGHCFRPVAQAMYDRRLPPMPDDDEDQVEGDEYADRYDDEREDR